VELLVNDLSFHGQFHELSSFRAALAEFMRLRVTARSYGRAIHCHRNLLNAQVTQNSIMPQAVQAIPANERRALLQWITQHGPFWEDLRKHTADDLFECNGRLVTDTAVAEAACCCALGFEHGLVSLSPSDWNLAPLVVNWTVDSAPTKTLSVRNFWTSDKLEAALACSFEIRSWEELKSISTARCTNLIFGQEAFEPLDGYPFAPSAAKRILVILEILHQFKVCFNSGQRTAEGHQIYRNYFTGQKGDGGRGALFSDSSDTEMEEFRREMTFAHPADSSKELFCSMHGKVQTPQLRVHFSWPVQESVPLYVMYIGPKITKR
jgi:hypothetical protein